MCLSIVARIIKILDSNLAIVELQNVRKKIDLGLLSSELKIGDWVLIHTGFAIAKVDEEKVKDVINSYEIPF